MPVDLAGQPCDLDPLLALGVPSSRTRRTPFESVYRGRKVGAHLRRDVLLALRDQEHRRRRGRAGRARTATTSPTRSGAMRLTRRGDGSRYDQTTPGFKANLSDVLAAIALVQLDRLDEHTRDPGAAVRALRRRAGRSRRDRAARRATRATCMPATSTSSGSTPSRAGATRDEYQRALGEELIATSIHFLPVHRLTWFRERYPGAAAAAGRRARRRRGAVVAALARALRRRHRRRDRRRPAGARPLHGMTETRSAVRVVATLVFTGLAVAYLLWKIDVGKTVDVLRDTRFGWFALAVAIMIATVVPMAVRWQWLLRRAGDGRAARLADARVLRLVHGRADPADGDRRRRGADLRDVEAPPRADGATSRRSSCSSAALGGAATVLLGAIGFVLAIGRYDVGAYLWLEGAFVFATFAADRRSSSRARRGPGSPRAAPLLGALRARAPAAGVLRGCPSLPRSRRACC